MVLMHGAAAMLFGIPRLAIDEQEGKMLADAAESVTKHYAYVPPVMKGPWLKVAGTMSMVYGTRIFEAMASPPGAKPAPGPQSPVTNRAPDDPSKLKVPGVELPPGISAEDLRAASQGGLI